MNDELVTIATFANSFQANLAKGELQEEGIHSVVAGDDPGGTLAFMTSSIGVKLCVRREDVKAARQALAETDGENLAAEQEAEIEESALSDEINPPADDKQSLTRREQEAVRAFRSAILGFFFFPLQIYTVWLLLRVFFSDERLEPQHRRWAWIAAIIAFPYACLALMLFKVLFFSG
jgi:hypothetical protein